MDEFIEIADAFDKFTRSYPFNHLNFKELKEYAESIERVYNIKELVDKFPLNSSKFDYLRAWLRRLDGIEIKKNPCSTNCCTCSELPQTLTPGYA